MIYNRRIGCVCSVWLLAGCSAPSDGGGDDPVRDVGAGGAGNSVLPPATTATAGTSNGGGTGLVDEIPGVEGNVPPVGGVTASGNVPCDVATIVRDHCSTCHGSEPKFNAPMSLTSAGDFAATAPISGTDPVRAVASRRVKADGAARMPPPGTVEALSDDELATLTAWLDGGASALDEGGCSILDQASTPGDEDLLPRPTTTGTTLGPFVGWDEGGVECYPLTAFQPGDKTTPYRVGTAVDKYMGFGFKPPWEGTRYVRAFKTIVDNDKVLHHWILFEEPTAADGNAAEILGAHPGGAMMHGWAPGGSDLYFTPDLGMRMDGNSSYLLEVHYNSNDPNAVDASGVEVCVSPQQPENEAIISWLGTDAISGTQAEGTCAPRATQPIHIVAGTPHMHLKGTHMKVTLTRAAGGTEVVHDEPFSFENQRGYQQNVTLQPGDRLTTSCSYSAPTTFGRGTNEEMCYWFALAYPAGALTDNGFIGTLTHGANACLGR
jgi:hypothetical protein